MQTASVDWLFPRAARIARGWLGALFSLPRETVETLRAHRASARQADARLRAFCGPPAQPQDPMLATLCLLDDQVRGQRIAALGWHACAPWLRTIIDGPRIARLQRQIGAQRYAELLACASTNANIIADDDDLVQRLVAAEERGQLEAYAATLGAGLVGALARDDAPFVARRLGLSLSPNVWRSRPRDIGVHRHAAQAALEQMDLA